MITLGDITTKQNFYLGTSEVNLYTLDKRTDAINRAITAILEEYDVPQYCITAPLSFIMGVASLPTDMLRPLTIKSTDSRTEYELIDIDKFDNQFAYKATIKWDTVSSTEKLYIFPADTVTLNFTYVQAHVDLVNAASTARFRPYWKSPIALKSTEILLSDSRNYNAAQAKESEARVSIAKAWTTETKSLTGNQDFKLTSVYAKPGFLKQPENLMTTTQVTAIQTLTWVLVSGTAQQMTSNIGYICTDAGLTILTLPLISSIGDVCIVESKAGQWQIAQNSGQSIVFGATQTTPGIGGYLASTLSADVVTLNCTGANSQWTVSSSIGNINVV